MATCLKALHPKNSVEVPNVLSQGEGSDIRQQPNNARLTNLQEQLKLYKRLRFNAKLDKAITGIFLFLILPTLTLCSFDSNAQRRNRIEGIGLILCGLSIGAQIILRHQDHKIGGHLNQLKQEGQVQTYV